MTENKPQGIGSTIRGIFKSATVSKASTAEEDDEHLLERWKSSVADMDLSSFLPDGQSIDSFWSDMSSKFKRKLKKHELDAATEADILADEDAWNIGKKLAAAGREVHHPVVIIPGFTSTGLESWCVGDACTSGSSHFRHRLWGSLSMVKLIIKSKSDWVNHLALDPETGLDPPKETGIKLRAAQGFDAADYFVGSYWVWAKLLQNLAEVGYDRNTMHLAAYDWRLAMEDLERRDGYFTRLKSQCEVMVKTNQGRKVVVVAHSMGVIVFFYFLQWVHAKEGGNAPNWGKEYLAGFVNVAGPLLGAPKSLMALLSGDMRDTVMQPLGAQALEKFFGRTERAGLFRTWGSLAAMIPKGGNPVWGGEIAPKKKGPDGGVGDASVQANVMGAAPDGTLTSAMLVVTTLAKKEASKDKEASVSDTTSFVTQLGVEETLEELQKSAGTAWVKRFHGMYSFGLNQDGQVDQREWVNPLEAPLPNMGHDMKIYNFYGVGAKTERAYAYLPPQKDETIGKIDASHTNEAISLERGVLLGDGDGTVPLVSLGLMGATAWRHDHWNANQVPICVREYKDVPNTKLERGGPTCADHVNILGNAEMTLDILNIVTGHASAVQERYLTNIQEIGQGILKRIDERAVLESGHESSEADGKRVTVKKWIGRIFKH